MQETQSHSKFLYCPSLTKYQRRQTIEVKIGDVPLGGNNPIRVQTMTISDTMNTPAVVAECIRLIEAGSEYIRITAPSIKEAENLQNIKKELRKLGYTTPLIADIHFTPNAAELAARIVEKVRINPGNFADRKRFEIIEYTEAEYQAELERIREKFVPLLKICKEYGTALRIGTNHGSLSDRIMSRYGDNPLGMVESALEFLRIAEDEGFYNIVLSMKSSNPQVMVQAYRLLVQRLQEEGLKPYPLHLGVTEAGDGEDGRIKSAVGIGTLLEDGLGDTVRVSLTEDPEYEIPVAKKLVNRYTEREKLQKPIPAIENYPINPFAYHRRETCEILNIGAKNVPRVIADFSTFEKIEMDDLKKIGHFYLPATDKWAMNDLGADFLYLGNKSVPFMLPNGLQAIQDYQVWLKQKTEKAYPLCNLTEYLSCNDFSPTLNFLLLDVDSTDLQGELLHRLQNEKKSWVMVLKTGNPHALPAVRALVVRLIQNRIDLPVIIWRSYCTQDLEQLQIDASTDIGGLLLDGLGDGLMISVPNELISEGNSLAFGILQATRTRITKTEYISCPSCGRTLFDLQEVTAKIRKRTDHLKGVKIAIMGCIVNGPGEMADADYGYVGSGKGKISLYRGKEIVKRTVAEENALDELINLIKEDGKWIEPV
ncbi:MULTISPECIES: (E)-4-hydroxy-3-methylbut-2-enyl-diphosphate synthase [Raineya]|jgi:(E)-4-hydroxy-3-methylbut-2-enyl-diphosphate synthase|uniref:4-hydroxy-3-methylbut-2-en-1-yl diphosphate synthase (flavodoxin) n=1 Tax=Raineya orbicola TaxID=2016530 RepID=A0A2N3IE51_9BACT|nr:(E)-4-hydroxy-3-methylbut-2-enyl-diphosphate synthase [Raineya orbicola]PKQ68555.1 4-hydroxy-3-methylbut-2-en-1-yl diphosphate synthase [Raineya orbicola]